MLDLTYPAVRSVLFSLDAERAHHLTLAPRLDGYRPAQLTRLLEERRSLFEHWTHDACVIPTAFFPHWEHRFEQARKKVARGFYAKRLGKKPAKVLDHVRELHPDLPWAPWL